MYISRFTRQVCAGLGTAALTLGLAGAAPAAAQDTAAAGPVSWEPCPEQVTDPTAECGRIDVPMHYSDPAGAAISVGFVRIPATGESRGTLFGNPGGPGGDAYSYFGNDDLYAWPEEITAEWDRVAVQPRGLPGSTPVDCTNDPGWHLVDIVTRQGGYIKAACELGTPGYTDSLTTSNTAEDWEMVRRALGIEQISIMGLSYGTFLGSVYATRYPQHTDRVVLDSAMDPSLAWSGILGAQQEGYESALHNFLAWVAERNHIYGLGETPLQVYQAWSRKVVAESGTNPTVVPPPAQVGDVPPGLRGSSQPAAELITSSGKARVEIEGVVSRAQNPGAVQSTSPTLLATRNLLPAPREWDGLARVINGTREIPEQELDENAVLEFNTAIAMQTLLICNENQIAPNPADLPRYAWSNYVTGDIFTAPNAAATSGASCSGITPVTGAPALDGSGLATRPLQINATDDPQTPYQHRHTIADAMNTQMVTVHGNGHAHVAVGNDAVDDIVVEYLRTGVSPATEAPGIS